MIASKLLACVALLALATGAQGESTRTASGKSTSAKAPVSTTKSAAKPAAKPKAVADEDITPPEEELEHIVKDGETLGGIANRTKVPRVLIIEANHLKAPYAVKLGQKLILPRTRHHTVKKGETGFDIAYKYGVPFGDIAVANGMEADAKVKPGQKLLIPSVVKPTPKADSKAEPAPKSDTPKADPSEPAEKPAPALRLLWPVEAKVRRGFTPRSKTDDNGDYHEGLDIPATQGTAVRASASGTVLFAGKEPERFGNMVVIEHEDGWQTAYGFLSKVTVKKGDTVTAHERVGLVGHAGQASRDELHFELRRANKPVDPSAYLPKVKKNAEAKKPEQKKNDKKPDAKKPKG